MEEVRIEFERVNEYEVVIDGLRPGWCGIPKPLVRWALMKSKEGSFFPFHFTKRLKKWSDVDNSAYRLEEIPSTDMATGE